MRKHVHVLLFIVALAGPLTLSAQDSTKVVSISTRWFGERELSRNAPPRQVDSTTKRIEAFHNLFRQYTLYQDLGNIGTPAQSLYFKPERNTGFEACFNPFDGYFMKNESTRYYNTRTPYSDLFFALGSEELIYLTAKHYQNILPRWNLGVDFQRITSQGFFLRQYTSMYNFQFSTSYSSKRKRYAMIAHTTFNRGIVEESGGIQSDSAFETLSGASKTVYPNLLNSQTRFKAREGMLKQYLRFGRGQNIIKDADTIFDLDHRAQVSWMFRASDISYIFENSASGTGFDRYTPLLPNQYYDTLQQTMDSLYSGKMENRLGLDLYSGEPSVANDSLKKYFGIGATHALMVVSQNPYVRNFDNIIADVRYEHYYAKRGLPSFDLGGSYCVAGYNAGDYKAQGNVFYRFRPMVLRVEALNQLYRPDFNFQLFKSNQFIWTNNFDKTSLTRIGLLLSSTRFRHNVTLRVNQHLLNNWVYVGTDGTPKQETSPFSVTTVDVTKTFQLWKIFLEHQVIWQRSSSPVVRLPELGGNIRYYIAFRVKTLKAQAGFNVYYHSAFYANNYNPATRLFFLQDRKAIGDYPILEPFLVGEVKRLAFFLKYEHLNQDWFGSEGAYATPSYPLSLSSFRFGGRWRFYD